MVSLLRLCGRDTHLVKSISIRFLIGCSKACFLTSWFLTLDQVNLSFFMEKLTTDSEAYLLSFKSAAIFPPKISRMCMLLITVMCQKSGMLQNKILFSVKRPSRSGNEIALTITKGVMSFYGRPFFLNKISKFENCQKNSFAG
mgnify:CR=1 FL=1